LASDGTRFADRTALVTGAAQGMGAAIAEHLLREGARVVLFDHDADTLERTADRLRADADADGRLLAVPGDVSSREDVRAAVTTARDAWGDLHIAIAQAGIGGVVAFEYSDDDAWRRMFAVNVDGVFLTVQEAARAMTRGGSIVVTASTNSFFVEGHTAHYSATKGAVRTFVRSAALDLGERGIRVNVVHPGIIRTRLATLLIDDPVAGPRYLERVPLGRFGEPDDIARAVLFLASDDAAYVTGADLVVDGGATLGVTLGVGDQELGG
jgi:NAD(P)-dependent dehydrogenase (short-subunit alcohol dehydrogenase family)